MTNVMSMIDPPQPLARPVNHVKMPHHTRSVVFEDVAVIHPTAGAPIGHPGDFYGVAFFDIYGVHPAIELGICRKSRASV